MGRVRHVYARRGEYIKVHRAKSGGDGCGCLILIVIVIIVLGLL